MAENDRVQAHGEGSVMHVCGYELMILSTLLSTLRVLWVDWRRR